MKINKLTLGAVAILCAGGILTGATIAQSRLKKLVVWADGGVVATAATDPTGKGKYGLALKQIFEKEHPGVTVELVDMGWDEQLRQNLTNALLAGTAPDVIVGEGFFKNYASLGALLPIDISKLKNNMVLGTIQGSTYKGKVYGLAGYTSVFGFERNCAVVKQAGIDCDKAPKTWDDLLAQAKTITEKGAGKYYGVTIQGPGNYALGAAFRNYVYLLQTGGDMAKPGVGGLDIPAFNDPKAVKTYEFLRELNKYTPPGLTFEGDEGKLYSQLFAGVSAYQMAGGWHVGWAKESKCADCRYSEPPLPAGGKPASVIVANVIYGALKTSKNAKLATDFVKFTQRDEVQSVAFSSTGRLPTTRSALKALRPSVDAPTQAFIDTLLNSSNLNAMPQWEKNPQKIWQAYTDFLNKLYTTTTPVSALLEELQKAAEAAAK
jgi:multiple sugar transport system substrate-binding protein